MKSRAIYLLEHLQQVHDLAQGWHICPFCSNCELEICGKLGSFWWETGCGKFSNLCRNQWEMESILQNCQRWQEKR